MADLIGQMLGQYQIVEQIGMGGMATVYKAYQANMDRYVAIKVLPRQLAEDPQFTGRFEQEARTIAKLENKHILPVYDYGQHNGHTYLVMRYIGTGTLKNLTGQGALPLPDAVQYFTQIADALQYAHDHGVIHRDIKTSNVLIGDGKTCYLTDFGIAKLAASSAHFTGTGGVIGTPAYMSPEQCHGLPVDARSDIYSLGIVLYEMLTGVVPFEAETPVAVVLKQINEPLPPPRNLNMAIPEAVEKVLFRALAKEPDHRYQSAADFSEALQDAFESFTEKQTVMFAHAPLAPAAMAPTQTAAPTAPVAAAPERARPRWLLFAGLAALALAAVIIGLLVLAGGEDDEEAQDEPPATAEVVNTPFEITPPGVDVTPTGAEVAPPGVEVTPTPAEVAMGGPETPDSLWTVFSNTQSYDGDDHQLLITEHALWVSSSGGLMRWQSDGTYTRYTSADGLAFNDIQTMSLDAAGNIWLGGGSVYGVMRLQLDENDRLAQVDYYDPSNSGDLQSWNFWTFWPDPDGSVIAATYETRLEFWNGQQWAAPAWTSKGLDVVGDRAWALLRSRDGTLWVGGPSGLVRSSGDSWESIPPPDDLPPGEYEAYNYVSLYEDPLDGAIWVSLLTQPDWRLHARQLVLGENSLWGWQLVSVELPEPLINGLRAADDSLWLVGQDSVIHLDSASGRREVFGSGQGLRGDRYFDIAQDADGTIWVTTNTALAYYDGRRWISYGPGSEPPSNHNVAMAEAPDGTLWFLSDYGHLFRYRGGQWESVEYFDTETYDLALQGDVIWVASDDGLYRWESGAYRLYSPDNGDNMNSSVVLTLAVDQNHPDRLWFGTTNGLHLYNAADDTIRFWARAEDNDFPGPGIMALYFDRGGALWVGSAFGDDESWIGPGEAQVIQIADPSDLDNLTWEVRAALNAPFYEGDWNVLAIAEDEQGSLWIGTDESLYRRVGDRWQKWIESDGAPEFEAIQDMVLVNGIAWIATENEGLYRYDAAGWYHLGREGIGANHLHDLYRASDGALWILGGSGITRLMGDPLAQ
jgi:ligand-binding sensor domain-containing protein/tRNA A-37 threonylcarbamoyl transferase component Bud32